MRLQENNPDKINWVCLSSNPLECAIKLLEKNPDKINWEMLSYNTSERAIKLLEKNQDKIDWQSLCFNESEGAMKLLEKNPDKINWRVISCNTNIFTYDYKKMRLNCMLFKEDLIKNRLHPCNIAKFKDWRINGFDSGTD